MLHIFFSLIMLFCPTHNPTSMSPPFLFPSFQQLKNQINALFSSRPGGTKSFNLDGTDFGWREIQGMFARECERRDAGKARMVPKLRETHVIRDSWTKLNVSPAKIMQVLFSVGKSLKSGSLLCLLWVFFTFGVQSQHCLFQ